MFTISLTWLQNGVPQAAELASVGAIANKVKAFVDHVQEQQAAAEAAGDKPAETSGDAKQKVRLVNYDWNDQTYW